MADTQSRPDDIIFAKDALTGEVEAFDGLARGWGSTLVHSKGIPPMEWFNFIGQRSDKGIHYILQQGIDVWNSAEAYPAGSIVKVLADNCLYKAIAANTNKSPTSNGASWLKVLDLTAATAAAHQVGRAVGNVVQVGAFGVGSTAEAVTDANNISVSGFYSLPATGLHVPPVSGQAIEVIHVQYNATTATQIAKGINKRTLYVRDKVNNVWTGWEGQYGPSNKPTAEDLGINQDYIPMDGSEAVRGNIGLQGWVHIARSSSDLFRAANDKGVGISEVIGNVAGGEAVQQRLTSVSVTAGSYTSFSGVWGSVQMTAIRQILQSGGSTKYDFDVCRAGSMADRRITGFSVDGANSRAETKNGFTLWESGVRVYSPNNPQPIDTSWAVTSIRLGSETMVGMSYTGGRTPEGYVMTGIQGWKVTGPDFAMSAMACRPLQININGEWYTASQLA